MQPTFTVTVSVSGSGAGSTAVDLYGANYNQSNVGYGSDFAVQFSNVPNGDYTARAQYGNTEQTTSVTVNGADASVSIAMGLPPVAPTSDASA